MGGGKGKATAGATGKDMMMAVALHDRDIFYAWIVRGSKAGCIMSDLLITGLLGGESALREISSGIHGIRDTVDIKKKKAASSL